MRAAFLALSLFSPVAFAQDASTALEQVLAASSDGALYAYDMILEMPDITASGRVDPTAEEGSRISVTSPAKEDWPEDFAKGLAEMEKNVDGDIWCAQFAVNIPSDALLVSEDGKRATYEFKPQPDPDEPDDAKLMKHLTGKVTIDTVDPAILGLHLIAPEPFKPAMVAKLNTFEMKVTCSRAPDGRTFIQEMSVHAAGSALMKSFDEKTTRTITKLYPTGS